MDAKCSPHGARRAGVASLSDARTRQRFSRRDRLTRKVEFDRVLRGRSERLASGPLTALTCPSPTGAPRLGLVVGKRNCPRAVDRNRIRRLVRESFRRRRASLPAMDIVVQLARPPQGQDLAAAIERIWERLQMPESAR